MDKILSIIIPTYNMEKYLNYCLDSLIIKKHFESLEVLIINDGSKDNSLNIALEYEKKYPLVFRVINKDNGNYGSCVNRGFKEATVKYIKILDADDSFHTENFEIFISYLLDIEADLILSDYAIVNENRELQSVHQYNFACNKEHCMNDICITPSFKDMQMHAVTYRRQILIELGYNQTEGISYTDQEWIFIPMLKVNKVYAFDKYVYKYLIGREGQTMSSSIRIKNLSHLMKCMYGMINSYNFFYDEINHCKMEYFHARLIPQLKEIYILSFSCYSKFVSQQLILFDKEIKKKNLEIYSLIEQTNVKFNYIAFWRNNMRLNTFLVKIMTRIFLYLIYTKEKC